MEKDSSRKVVVYDGNPLEAEMVLDMLHTYGIDAYLKNQYMGYIAPWHVSAGGFNPVEVEVPGNDRQKAIDIITDYRRQTKS